MMAAGADHSTVLVALTRAIYYWKTSLLVHGTRFSQPLTRYHMRPGTSRLARHKIVRATPARRTRTAPRPRSQYLLRSLGGS